jgi:hypothetical protein
MQASELINRHHRVILARRTYRRNGASMLEATSAVADEGKLLGIERNETCIDPKHCQVRVNGEWMDYDAERPPANADQRWDEGDQSYDLVTRWVHDPLDDAAFAAETARLLALPTHTLEVWLTPIQRGRVSLAGSRDRWIYATGMGGYLENARSAYGTAGEAEAAARAHLESLRDEIAQGIRAIFAPVADVTIQMPPIGIEIVGDASLVFPQPPRRAERRAMAAALGAAGGGSTSDAKAAAARANGRKGGRPRKQP